MAKPLHIALVGNPNSGKSSLFNSLTGLNQKVGNFPGVTVDKKTGYAKINDVTLEIVDLPGAYSLYPKSIDDMPPLTRTFPSGLKQNFSPYHDRWSRHGSG